MQSLQNISMCLPPVQALGLWYDPPDIKDMLTEEARIPTNVAATGKSSRQNRSRINYVVRNSSSRNAGDKATQPPNPNFNGFTDYCWVDGSSLGTSLYQFGDKLANDPFCHALKIPSSATIDALRVLSERVVSYRSPHKSKEGRGLANVVRDVAHKSNSTDEKLLNFSVDKSGGEYYGFEGSDDRLRFDERRVSSAAKSTQDMAIQLCDWLQQTFDTAVLRGGFKAASAQLGTGALCEEPIMKLNFQTPEGASTSATNERTHKIEINAIALSRHVGWEVEARLLLSRIGGTKNVRDPQMDAAYSSSASYSPTEDADCAGSLPLMWEGILLAKLVKAAMRRLWHRDVQGESNVLKTPPTLNSDMLKSKFTIPIGEPGKPRLLCIDPTKMLNDEQAIRNHEASIRKQLNPTDPTTAAAGSSNDPIEVDAPARLFPSAVHAQDKVGVSQVNQLAQKTIMAQTNDGAETPEETEARRETFQAGTHPGEKDLAEPYRTQLALVGTASNAKLMTMSKKHEHNTNKRLYSNYDVDPWFSHTQQALQSIGLTQNKSMSMFVNELRTSAISNARALELKAEFARMDADDTVEYDEGDSPDVYA